MQKKVVKTLLSVVVLSSSVAVCMPGDGAS